MEILLNFIIRNVWKRGENYEALKVLNRDKTSQSDGLIPLEPYPNWLEGILQVLLFFFGICLVFSVFIEYGEKGLSQLFFWFLGGFGSICFVILVMLFNTDSRYVLDMKAKQVNYVFTFFTWRWVTPVTVFSNVLSIQLDAERVDNKALGDWQYRLTLVKKTSERVFLTRPVFNSWVLRDIGEMIAQAIQCPYRDGKQNENPLFMGMFFQ